MRPFAIAFLLVAVFSSASWLRAAPDSGAMQAQPDPYAKVAEPPAHAPTFVPDRAVPDPEAQVTEPSTAAPSSAPGVTVTFDPTVIAARDFAQVRTQAEKGDAAAQFALGNRYDWGQGTPNDPAQAMKWYRKAADQGYAPAEFFLGLSLGMGKDGPVDRSGSIKWIFKAAEQDYAPAEFYLWTAYLFGFDVPYDLPKAVLWLRAAAEHGYSNSRTILAYRYEIGDSVPQDGAEAARWYRRAVSQGGLNADVAEISLAKMYSAGVCVPKDEVEALAWWNIASAVGDEEAVANRATMERALGPQISIMAQQRSKEILKEIEAAKTPPPAAAAGERATPKSSGSGAIVSAQGLVLTAAHVVADATRLWVLTAQGTREAKILRIDEANDLAILKIEGRALVPLPIAPSRNVRLGQSVSTIGFPNIGFQGFSPKVTRGEISSVNGFTDDPRSWQVSVPVQPGNSGGPLLDENGNLIGIVVSKLGLKAMQATGDIPQNVNYAVKSAYALALLEPYLGNDAPEPNQATKSFEDMVAQAQQSVVLILAY